MAIVAAELILRKSAVVDNTTSNGGRMSATAVTDAVLNNLFPSVYKAERTTGSIVYRKGIWHVANDADLTLQNPQLWLDIVTSGDDWMTMFVGTDTDTQNDIVGTERKYGAGTLQTTVTAGGSTLIVTVEDVDLTTGNDQIFQNGDTIRITDMATVASTTGNEETHVINGAPTVSGNDVTITLTGTLSNGYTAGSASRVMSVIEPSDIAAATSSWTETSAGTGTYDEASYPLILDNIGSVYDTWTLTFSDATNFTVVGTNEGTIGSGTTGGDFTPSNSDFTKPFMTLESAGWGGTWASGDTITFTTSPATSNIWLKRVVPALASSLASNKTTPVLAGESV